MFTKLVKSFIQDESGQGTIEYAAMLALGAVIALFAYNNRQTITGAITATFNTCANYLGSIK